MCQWLSRHGYECVVHLRSPRQILYLTNARTYIQIGRTRDKTFHAVLIRNGRIAYEGGHPIVEIASTIHIWRRSTE